MKGIIRFQRTMIVTLVGLNILVFSSSFYGSLGSAFGHSLVGMAITIVILLLYSLFRRSKYNKKYLEPTSQSQEN